MSTVSVTLGTLVDSALDELQAPTEQGKLVILGSALDTDDTTFTLSTGSASQYDLIEIAAEVMLITDKSADANPVYTVSRAYARTTADSHSSGDVGYLNPQWHRQRVANAVKRAFPRLEALGVPLLTSAVFTPADADEHQWRLVLELPAETREVWSVRDDLAEIEGWEYIEGLPTASYSTGKVVKLPRVAVDDDDFNVTYQIPYRWSTYPSEPVEASTITVPEEAVGLPAAYAVAWLVSAREISRGELDRAQEWNTSEPTRGGVSMRLAQSKWQDFYRQLDEVRRVDTPQPRRTFRRRSGRSFWT